MLPRHLLRALAAAAALLLFAPLAGAQDYPARPVRMVVPFPPGGSTDVLARLFARSLGETLGQPVVIENKPGAGTVVGSDLVAKAAADGYTLLFSGASTYTVTPILYPSLPYDPDEALEPVGIIAATPLILLANPSKVRASDLRGLAAELQAHPDMAYGSFGSGSTSNFVGEMFNAALGASMLHVPYKGSAPAMTDLIGGQIPLTVDTVVAAEPQIRAGKVKAIAVSSARRSQLLPDVPTAAESGYPDVAFSTWFAITAPSGLPAHARDKLVSAVHRIMQDEDLRRKFVENGFEPEYGSPADYRERVADESQRLKAVAERANIAIR